MSPGKVSSLSRQVSNSGLMTHAVTLCALADDATRGSRFSSRSASGRLMMEREEWGGNNLKGVLAANQRQDRETVRTHPIRRPVRTFFCRSRTRYLPVASNFPAFCAVGSGNRGNRGAVLAPAELATIDPHPVQNHGQTSSDRDDRSTHPTSLSHPHAPCLQPRPFPTVDEQ